MKRAVDIAISLSALVVLAPVLALIAAAIWIADFHSPIYAGKRMAGTASRRDSASSRPQFRVMKFRTMRPGASQTGVNSTASGDSRITWIGKFLRRAKLDELPQLWNVLTGGMSLVGPRPQVPADAALYTADERRMLSVLPGITDLASLVFADEGEILAGADDPDLLYNRIIRPWKSRLALVYVDRRSFALDLRILALTGVALISRGRAIDGVARILDELEVDPLLIRMAGRREPLLPYAPPGTDDIVRNYPSQRAQAG